MKRVTRGRGKKTGGKAKKNKRPRQNTMYKIWGKVKVEPGGKTKGTFDIQPSVNPFRRVAERKITDGSRTKGTSFPANYSLGGPKSA